MDSPRATEINSLGTCMMKPGSRQSLRGTFLGAVGDAKGAWIPRATVEVINRDTSITRTLTTGRTGTYRVPGLELRNYSAAASITGFRRWGIERLSPVTCESRRFHFTLEAGSTRGTITVRAGTGCLFSLSQSMQEDCIVRRALE